MRRWKRPSGCEVQTARCFVQRAQPQARTGIVGPDSGQSKAMRMLPQWQLPRIRRWETVSGMSAAFGGGLKGQLAVERVGVGRVDAGDGDPLAAQLRVLNEQVPGMGIDVRHRSRLLSGNE